MAQDENIPFAFEADHWVASSPNLANLLQDDVYLKKDATTLRQAHRGEDEPKLPETATLRQPRRGGRA